MSKQIMDESQLLLNQHSHAAEPSNGGLAIIPENTEASSFHRNEAVVVNEEDNEVEDDYFDGVLNYIDQILNEDDLEEKAFMYHDCLALQAAEENLYQVLHEVDPRVPSESLRSSSVELGTGVFNDPNDDFNSIWGIQPSGIDATISNTCEERSNRSGAVGTSRVREEDDNQQTDDGRAMKLVATSSTAESEKTEDLDEALLCPHKDPNFYGESPRSIYREESSAIKEGEDDRSGLNVVQPNTGKRGRPKASDKRKNMISEPVNLGDLLLRCSRSVALYEFRAAQELLKNIRSHSSSLGNSTQRLAHYMANALEARIAGKGSNQYAAFTARRVSCGDILEAYLTYVRICPFQRMSNIFANKSIGRFTRSAAKIHVIDFGISDGLQWPCLIHGLSLKPDGAPSLRITGIDFPQSGFHPSESVEQTGRRLATYAKRFNIPFQYDSIAKKWDTITLDDIKIDKDEMLVVNCLYKLKNINDEVLDENSSRDLVMMFIRNLNPDLFVHGVLNAGYNAPFFETRFKEAMHHFSGLFGMFEATLPREDEHRLTFESEILGRDIMNVIACEGSARIDRPECYRQWQLRNERVGFKQLPLDKKIKKEVKFKVDKTIYDKDYLADEENNWLVQGFKGRAIYAISCWTPSNNN